MAAIELSGRIGAKSTGAKSTGPKSTGMKALCKTGGALTAVALLALLTVGCVEAPSAVGPGPTQTDALTTPGTATAALPPETSEQNAPPPVTIEGLMGADEARLHRLLGLPQFRRNDPPARLLRYRAEGCLLDLFLYPPKDGAKDGAGHRVTHIQARGRDGMDRPAPPCLKTILETRAKAKTG